MNNHFNNFYARTSKVTGISTLTELANILNVHRSAMTQARKKDSIPARWILSLVKKYGLNPEWLETGNGPRMVQPLDGPNHTFSPVPKVKARLCAGGGSFDTDENIQGYYSFQSDWLRHKGVAAKMVLMDVFGNSMIPEIKDGDTVLIDQSQNDIIAGAIYAVGIDETIMVKRIEKHPRKLVLLSDNNEYAPIFLSDEEADRIRIIGKVLWICRELR